MPVHQAVEQIGWSKWVVAHLCMLVSWVRGRNIEVPMAHRRHRHCPYTFAFLQIHLYHPPGRSNKDHDAQGKHV